jgi:hypothetical protein
MGKTAFSGPAYGAKSLLWSFRETHSTGGSTVLLAKRVVPPYEDWFITEGYAHYGLGSASTISSAATKLILKSEGGSTTGIIRTDYPSTVAQTVMTFQKDGSTTATTTNVTATASPGEYEGVYVPAGSTLRVVSSGVDAIAVSMNVMGFIRWVPSTRAS